MSRHDYPPRSSNTILQILQECQVSRCGHRFNIINSNFLTGNCAHGIVMGENAADNTFALNHVINNPGFGCAKRFCSESRFAFLSLEMIKRLS